MKVKIFDNDDCVTDELAIDISTSGFESLVSSLDGKDRVYAFLKVDGDRTVILLGNGDRFVVNYEERGAVKWLVQSNPDCDRLVELVADDPARTHEYRTTVNVQEAVKACENVWGIGDLPSSVVWE